MKRHTRENPGVESRYKKLSRVQKAGVWIAGVGAVAATAPVFNTFLQILAFEANEATGEISIASSDTEGTYYDDSDVATYEMLDELFEKDGEIMIGSLGVGAALGALGGAIYLIGRRSGGEENLLSNYPLTPSGSAPLMYAEAREAMGSPRVWDANRPI